ncbi:MAG: copper chaperone PCu(A)C [Ilumatobacteraceae bacterium]
MPRRSLLRTALTLGAGASLVLAACGDDTEEAADTTAAATATTAGGEASGESTAAIAIDGAWARTSPMMASAGAAYMTITSPTDDALIRASVDPSVAGVVELHETRMVEGDMGGMDMTETTMGGMDMTETTMGGMDMTETTMGEMAPAMEMVPVQQIDLAAGEPVALAPGGLHIMLLELAGPLEVGTTIQITLEFANAGSLVVDVPVLDEAP